MSRNFPGGSESSASAASGLRWRADLAAVYDRAWWFARFVADSHGTGTLRRLYAAACGPGHADLAAAVRQVIGTDLADLQRRWAQWMAQEARR